MWILVSPAFIKWFTPKNMGGITFFPFIILKEERLKTDKTFLHHEYIHLHQQAELFVLLFLLLYAGEFLIRWLQYRNAYEAYRNISFEREAYDNEANYDYLKTRKWLAFTKYW